MPISEIDNCSREHWAEVFSIFKDSISDAGYTVKLVSDSDEVGVVHANIVQNLYDNEIVVCDVSANNPNVMFELGMRLAFDKPTIIVIDDKTKFSFDTNVIEHITYPRDLRFSKIIEFKRLLKDKVIKTIAKFKTNENYTTFLKHFGKFKIANLEEKEITSDKYIIKELGKISEAINYLALKHESITADYTDYVIIDASDLLMKSKIFEVEISELRTLREFLDLVYFQIADYVGAFTYGHDWLLIDSGTGQQIRVQIPQAKGTPFYDERDIMSLGIRHKSTFRVKLLN